MAEEEYGARIGISLGRTNSCVGVCQQDRGGVNIIKTTPSYLAFTDEDILFGDAAKNQFTVNPTNTIFDMKCLIGRRYSDASVQSDIKRLPFKVIGGEGDKPRIIVTHKGKEMQLTAEEITSMFLEKMKETAEAYLGSTVNEAVISVPSYFNYSQILAIKDAGLLSGFSVVDIITEPTAAAMAYGLHHKIMTAFSKKNVLIFHLGGSTCDVSLLTIENGNLKLKAAVGDSQLGGQDFDSRLVDHVAQQFKDNSNINKDISAKLNTLPSLKTTCERTKCNLSEDENVNSAWVVIESDEGTTFATEIQRSDFEDLNKDLFIKCMELVDKCLRDAKIDMSSVWGIVLVGGSTRIPKVQQLLKDKFGNKKIWKSIDPDEVVAYGASLNGNRAVDDNITVSLSRNTPSHVACGITKQRNEITIINGEGMTPGELLHKKIAKAVTHDTHMNHHPADYELKLENYPKPYLCDGCKEIGLGLGYKCKHCDFKIHKNCVGNSSTWREFFEENLHFTFLDQPPNKCQHCSSKEHKRTSCKACGKAIYGFAYHCEAKGWYLHPCCLDLKNEFKINDEGGGVKFQLRKNLSSKCNCCGEKWVEGSKAGYRGWSYVSDCKKYNFHVYCTTTMVVQSWQEGSGGDNRCLDLEILKLSNIRDIKKRNGGEGGKAWKIVLRYLRNILGILLGDPIAIASLLMDIVSTVKFFSA